jgi:hypothetical protein
MRDGRIEELEFALIGFMVTTSVENAKPTAAAQ